VVVRDEERDKELRKLDEKIEQLRAKIQEREGDIEDGPRWRTTATLVSAVTAAAGSATAHPSLIGDGCLGGSGITPRRLGKPAARCADSRTRHCGLLDDD
jgi:hypothetical protein